MTIKKVKFCLYCHCELTGDHVRFCGKDHTSLWRSVSTDEQLLSQVDVIMLERYPNADHAGVKSPQQRAQDRAWVGRLTTPSRQQQQTTYAKPGRPPKVGRAEKATLSKIVEEAIKKVSEK